MANLNCFHQEPFRLLLSYGEAITPSCQSSQTEDEPPSICTRAMRPLWNELPEFRLAARTHRVPLQSAMGLRGRNQLRKVNVRECARLEINPGGLQTDRS